MEDTVSNDLRANFRWQSTASSSAVLSLSDLKNEAVVERHLTILTNHFGSPTRAHAASMTAKRAGYAVALLIYARLRYNIVVNSSNCFLMTADEPSAAPGWLPVYSFPLNSAESEQDAVNWITKELYAETLVPIIEVLAKEKGISRAVLFENVFVYMKWIFVTKLQDSDLFQQLLETPVSEFGYTKRHPFAYYEDTSNGLRRTCCLRYQTVGEERTCKACSLK